MRYKTEKKQFLCPVLNQQVNMTIESMQSDGAAFNDWKLRSIIYCSCGRYDECPSKDGYDRCAVIQKYC